MLIKFLNIITRTSLYLGLLEKVTSHYTLLQFLVKLIWLLHKLSELLDKKILAWFNLFSNGPYTNYIPQLIVVSEICVRFGDKPYGNIIEQIYQGNHDLNGVFIAIGDDVGEEHSGTRKIIVYSVMFIVLYYPGLPLPHPCTVDR